MMRSLFSGVSGLRTHQTKMDVIGNNIANVNTTAYKSQSITFRDLMYQTTQRASGANALTGVGGTNAKQIGLGVTTGAINTSITSQGSAQSTNNPFDVMISGDGFFVVGNGQENFFTRDGSFYVDGQGNLAMTSTGYNVMGWQVDPTTGEPKADTVSALRVMNEANMTYPPEATSQSRVSGIIDANDTKVNSSSGRIVNMEFYDSLGYKYTGKFSIHGTQKAGDFYVKLDSVLDSTGKKVDDSVMNSISFGNPNLIVDVTKAYNTINGTALGTGAFKLTSGTDSFTGTIGAAVTTMPGNTTPDYKVLADTYKDVDFAKVTGYTIDGSGKIKVTSADTTIGGKEYSPSKGAFTFTEILVADKTNVAINKSFTVGTEVDATAYNAADKGLIKSLYGVDIEAAGVQAFMVNADGTLTVTKQAVKKAAILSYNTAGTNPKGELISANGNGEGTMVMSFGGIGRFSDITIDFSGSSNVNNSGSSTIGSVPGDENNLGAGRRIGELMAIMISKEGIITASYDNNMSRKLGQIAVATFANASGLEKRGDNLYGSTANSGAFDGIGEDVTAGGGRMDSGVLEMSNVDLSAEFTEMITTQRGFQANSRIITVSDSLLEELTNLKR